MNKDGIESALNVTTISTDQAITEVLLYANWTVEDGIQYLVGIFDEHIDENNVGHLVTLGNVHYSEKDNKEIYDAFFAKYDRLKRIWNSSHKKERYAKTHFIEWALRNKKICEITWLDDAVNQGLVSISSPTKQPDKKLGERERNSYYRIITALVDTLISENSGDASKPHLKNQSALIKHLVDRYKGYEGLSKTNLENVFSEGKKLVP